MEPDNEFKIALADTIIDLSNWDRNLAWTLVTLVQGPAWNEHTEGAYVKDHFLRRIGTSARMHLLRDMIIEIYSGSDHGVDERPAEPDWLKDFMKDMQLILARRNRLVHDFWIVDGDFEETGEAWLYPAGTMSATPDQEVNTESLQALRKVIQKSNRAILDLQEHPDLVSEDGEWSYKRAENRTRHRD